MKTCQYDPNTDAEPTCPHCGHYNAMLVSHDWVDGEPGYLDGMKCRDCGGLAILVREVN